MRSCCFPRPTGPRVAEGYERFRSEGWPKRRLADGARAGAPAAGGRQADAATAAAAAAAARATAATAAPAATRTTAATTAGTAAATAARTARATIATGAGQRAARP